ncbi:hypothetical protein B0H34DRAFT_349660 [Crassisporium funariophilum]|nr:hypothetical protein B0H34DRAFT_349660 [Crassisporium funariophilum]
MHLFRIRSKSATKQAARQPEPVPTPLSSASSSRTPLLPQTNLHFQSSQSSVTSDETNFSSSSSEPSLSSNPSSKHGLGRKITLREQDEFSKSKPSQSSAPRPSETQIGRGLAPSPRTPSRSTRTTYTSHPEMYTQNDLNTFSFGAAPSASSSSLSRPVDPLSRPCDETDSDEVVPIPDTTPRPSVVGGQHHRSHQSQPLGAVDRQTSFSPTRKKSSAKGAGQKIRERDSDTASTHTFGNSSASASASSLSRPSAANSYAASWISRSNTPLTSAHDLTSDEEMEMDGRHPLPPERSSSSLHHCLRNADQESSIYTSDEELDGYNEDYDHDADTGIEIDSVAHEGSDRGTFDYAAASAENVRSNNGERRGSQAMPINTPSDRSYLENRARENSFATLRRPSRSLDELHSFTFSQAGGNPPSGPRDLDERPLPPAPTSVPESEGDWRDLRKRSIQRDKDLPSISPHTTSTALDFRSNINPGTTPLPVANSSATEDFNWMHQYGVNGVVNFELSEMDDIVGESSRGGRRPSNFTFRTGSTSSTFRRESTTSSNGVDIIHRHIMGDWASQKYRDQRQMWTFKKEKDRISDEEAGSRHNVGIDTHRPSISTLFGSRPSTANESYIIAPFFDKVDSKDKEKLPAKEKTSKEPWKGMALDAEEFWCNGAIGKFRVNRKNATSLEAGKPPQQRLNITYVRSPFITNVTTRDTADGPAVTIHKHSKAGAFSISRHYRPKISPSAHDTTVSLRNPTSSVGTSSKDSADGGRRKSNMILLAPRRVQKAYTSTNTTRKLESHGLLDDSGRTSPRDVERMRREREREKQRARAKEKERERDNDRKGNEAKEKRRFGESSKKSGSKGEVKSRDNAVSAQAQPDSSGDSSAGSVSNALTLSSGDSETLINSSTAVTTPDPSEGAGSFGSIEQSINSYETNSSDRTISRTTLPQSHLRRRDAYEDMDDDSSEERPRYPARTPHREAYAALSPEAFENAQQEQPSHGLFGWGKSRVSSQGGHRANSYLEKPYNPPWPVTAPRYNSETRKGIVDDLNTSFQDVGLLPAIGEIKSSGHGVQQKRKRDQQQQILKQVKRDADITQADIFEEVALDALCMLLPLWPGETDTGSARKFPFTPPPISTSTRLYVLIYYRTPPAPVPAVEDSKTKSGEKKRSRGSPTSSHDSVNKRDERTVLLSNFHISARVVTYRELQGSGVRIPDVGLAVSGPLADAYESMPKSVRADDNYVLGICHSREAGIEFVPEGFEKMGLSRSIPNPNPRLSETNEDDDSQSLDTLVVLTPIGRAVMEMAWLGGLALTSFNPSS